MRNRIETVEDASNAYRNGDDAGVVSALKAAGVKRRDGEDFTLRNIEAIRKREDDRDLEEIFDNGYQGLILPALEAGSKSQLRQALRDTLDSIKDA